MIKHRPEDFRVEEVLAAGTFSRISGKSGPFMLYRLTKRSLGTDEALERIAKKLNVPLERIGYGGLKDKHALTMQYISLECPGSGEGIMPGPVETPAWRLEPVGRFDRHISAVDVTGNRFRVTVRNLTRRQCERMTEVRRLLSLPASGGRTLRFVNYYGEQRFGSARHKQGFAARRLIEGDFEGALKLLIAVPNRKDSRERKAVKRAIAAGWGRWGTLLKALPSCFERAIIERLAATNGDFRAGFSALPHFIKQITIEAYQSRLWNNVARRLIIQECPPPLITAPSRSLALVFPLAEGVDRRLASVDIPLFSPKTRLDEPWKTAAEGALHEEGIRLKDLRVSGLRIPYFGETLRPLFVEALEFSLGPVETDESREGKGRFKRRLRFFLPRGAYGTVLLGALEEAPQSILR